MIPCRSGSHLGTATYVLGRKRIRSRRSLTCLCEWCSSCQLLSRKLMCLRGFQDVANLLAARSSPRGSRSRWGKGDDDTAASDIADCRCLGSHVYCAKLGTRYDARALLSVLVPSLPLRYRAHTTAVPLPVFSPSMCFVGLMSVAWSVTEVIRYSWYAMKEATGFAPFPLTYCRYVALALHIPVARVRH